MEFTDMRIRVWNDGDINITTAGFDYASAGSAWGCQVAADMPGIREDIDRLVQTPEFKRTMMELGQLSRAIAIR